MILQPETWQVLGERFPTSFEGRQEMDVIRGVVLEWSVVSQLFDDAT
jgi:hypothetical protein